MGTRRPAAKCRRLLRPCMCGPGTSSGRLVTPELFLVLATALCALVVGVLIVVAWQDQDVTLTAILGVVLFSLVLVVMVAVRGSL